MEGISLFMPEDFEVYCFSSFQLEKFSGYGSVSKFRGSFLHRGRFKGSIFQWVGGLTGSVTRVCNYSLIEPNDWCNYKLFKIKGLFRSIVNHDIRERIERSSKCLRNFREWAFWKIFLSATQFFAPDLKNEDVISETYNFEQLWTYCINSNFYFTW